MAQKVLNLKTSSNVKSAVWDDETMGLAVIFHSGHGGVYAQVPEEVALGMEQADSPGNYLHTYVKPQYTYSKTS